mmetsp:Transcript_11545/g.19516  ORF Transcript_11545/g.19516 Transcript_11545/m.19516 type:complete len:94 (+) Transcript_11545:148-429(+)
MVETYSQDDSRPSSFIGMDPSVLTQDYLIDANQQFLGQVEDDHVSLNDVNDAAVSANTQASTVKAAVNGEPLPARAIIENPLANSAAPDVRDI